MSHDFSNSPIRGFNSIVETEQKISRMVGRLKICVNTQTPPLKFNISNQDLMRRIAGPTGALEIHSLKEGADFEYSPGGVTRMVLPLLAHMMKNGLADSAHWVCLNPEAPATVKMDDITVHHVNLARERKAGYGLAKENFWRVFHGLSRKADRESLWADGVLDYTFYNRVSAELIRNLDAREDFDLFYIHDFQQLPVGRMLRTLKPKVLRWHVPFEKSDIPPNWNAFLSTYLDSYDAIIVSCQSYLDSLKSLGCERPSFYVYPYVDQSVYTRPTQQDLNELKSRLRLRDDEKIVLLVARLDPMKGQDAVIKAIPEALSEVRKVKLLIIGDGSFSGSKQGLGLSKSERWQTELRNLVKSLHIEDNVTFTGYLPQRLLNAAYHTCDMAVLPSRQEGFGLVVVESWLYKKPALVSTKAGIAELINDGRNGLLIDPKDSVSIAEKISTVLTDQKLSSELGENGYLTSRKCLIDEGLRAEWEIISELI
jgi:glycosyltransferase involved in cell wall biosynthesis